MYNYKSVIDLVNELGCNLKENEPMHKYTTFKIGGNADLFVNVKTSSQLKSLLIYLNKEKIPVFVLGKGSNILVQDTGIRGVVLKLDDEFSKIRIIDNHKIECSAGVSLAKLCSEALKNGLSGLEFAWGIPGSVGGACYMNSGAYGGEMKDVIVSCDHIDTAGNFRTFNNSDLDFSYRHSAYSDKNYVIISTLVDLKNDDPEAIRFRMDDFMNRRKNKQPIKYPSAGSVFKRPEGYFAGTLIEQCGLKGKTIGGAQVSTKHAGFIINIGNATCTDVVNLIEFIQDRVQSKTGVFLERELKII